MTSKLDIVNDRILAPEILFRPCEAETPSSNTGLICQDLSLGIDYLTLAIPIADADDIHKLISTLSIIFQDAYDLHFDQGRFIGRQYSGWALSPNGGLLAWNLPGENGQDPHFGSLRLALSGGVLKRAKQLDIVQFMRIQLRNGAKCNRIDLRADDYTRVMLPEHLLDACRKKNISGFRNSRLHADTVGNIYECGWTIYLGSRESDRFTRYYNAFPVHGIEAFRYEIECKNEVADQIAYYLCICSDDEEALTSLMGAYLAGHISFVDRSGGSRASRCDKLPFWQAFTDRLGSSIRFSVPAVVRTIQKSIDWIEHSVSATLGMVAMYINPDDIESYIRRLIEFGKAKFSSRHQTILNASKMEFEKYYSIEDDTFVYTNKSIECST